MNRTNSLAIGLLVLVPLVACGSDGESNPSTRSESEEISDTFATTTASSDPVAADAQQYPDVVDAVATRNDDTWTFDVTISSPYDTPERYADGWRVLAPDGTELAMLELGHDHATEQPFTRSLDGVAIPDGVDTVTIEGRDLANGYGGATFDVAL